MRGHEKEDCYCRRCGAKKECIVPLKGEQVRFALLSKAYDPWVHFIIDAPLCEGCLEDLKKCWRESPKVEGETYLSDKLTSMKL